MRTKLISGGKLGMKKPTGCSPVRMATVLAGERMGGTPTSTSLLPGRVRSPKSERRACERRGREAEADRPAQASAKRPAADHGDDDKRSQHLEDDDVAVDREDREPQHIARTLKTTRIRSALSSVKGLSAGRRKAISGTLKSRTQ